MMSSWASTSLRHRSRNCDTATQQVRDQSRRRIAEQTLQTLNSFEEKLTAEKEALVKAMEDIPDEAEAAPRHRSHLGSSQNMGHSSSQTQLQQQLASAAIIATEADTPLQRSFSDSHLPEGFEKNARRPPSPLGLYDYGCISLRSRSLAAQRQQRRPGHESQTAAGRGFYFPGAHYQQGSYGFSLLEPILMRSKPSNPVPPSVRWSDGPSDARPLASEVIGLRRTRAHGPVISPQLRSSNAHTLRAKNAFSALDHTSAEAYFEHKRFQNGTSGGTWRGPELDADAQLPVKDPSEHSNWIWVPEDQKTPAQKRAADILFRLEARLRENRCRVKDLFASENKGIPGVLRPEEFLESLEKHRIIAKGEMAMEDLIDFCHIMDPDFVGLVTVPAAGRALQAARAVRRRRETEEARERRARQVKLSTTYTDYLPAEAVRVEAVPASLLDFNRARERFGKQQKQLLAFHDEFGPSLD